MYKAGVKKYGKAGMKAIQSAAGKGASAEEIGAIKDKHNKKKVKEEDETPRPMRRMSDEEKLAMFNELKAGDTVYLWYDSAFKRGEKYKPFKWADVLNQRNTIYQNFQCNKLVQKVFQLV